MTLRRRLTLWMCGAMAAGLAVFAIAAYIVVDLEEEDDAEVLAGTQQDPDSSATAQVLTALAIAGPIALALSVLAAAWASKRVAAPIERATQTAAAISVDRFDRRMDVPDDAAELRALALSINDLLDRLQGGYEALAEFSAAASHELRTPIAAISMELETALRRPRTPAEWEASARTSLDELRRLGGLVDAMLRFAKSGASLDAQAAVVDLADVVDDVAAIQAAAATAGGVELRVDHDGGAPLRVRANAELLGAGIANLVANAIRLTPSGGAVRVALASRGGGAEIAIEDQGPGLPADRDALFVPFARPSPASGVGLGLAIAKRIVERHGGTLAADDRADGGARFTIRIPRAR